MRKNFREEKGMELDIGRLLISGYAALAPMAGVADRAMREICISHGAAYAVGELTSAKGVTLGDLHFLFGQITGHFDDFHAVEQRRGDGLH